MLGADRDYRVDVICVNGAREHFTMREMRALYGSRQFWIMIGIAFAIMATGHPATLPQFDSIGLRLCFWFMALAIYLLASEPYMRAVSGLWRRATDRPIPLLVMTAPLILFSTYVPGVGLPLLFEPERPVFEVMTWEMNLRNLFIAHVFETMSVCYLLTTERARRRKADATRTITLAGGRVDLSKVIRVKAAEHYLEVHSPDGVQTLRERMATFLEQVEPADGIQTHRSHWVAADHVAGVEGAQLQLSDGGTVPIARGRIPAVQDWVGARMSNIAAQ
ncbi:MAG: LytTR family DNA-binding domain-containing protein [Pseudomonadota bacterium]